MKNPVDYITFDVERYKSEKSKTIIELIVATALLILTMINIINLSNLIKKNTELKHKVQEYQEQVVYYRHTYEDEV